MIIIILTACLSIAFCIGGAFAYTYWTEKKFQKNVVANRRNHPDPLNLDIYNRLNELPREINNEAINKLTQARDNFDHQKDRVERLQDELNSLIEQIHPYHGKNTADFSSNSDDAPS